MFLRKLNADDDDRPHKEVYMYEIDKAMVFFGFCGCSLLTALLITLKKCRHGCCNNTHNTAHLHNSVMTWLYDDPYTICLRSRPYNWRFAFRTMV